jgi:cell division protein FtsB
MEESQAAKERYMKYWKDKLAGIYTEQAQSIIEVGKQKEESKRELQRLEEEEIKLMEEINKYHSQGVETKKEYLAALSLPVKEVA